jgi:dinuclear metal center YbgI/SA1388 family protein
MVMLAEICDFLEAFAPAALAAEWDNVGLLVGDRAQKAERIMTCLTITPAAAAEAIREQADLIVTHHPLPFKPLKRLTADQPSGRILLDLIRAGIAIHSPHTAFDSAAAGINRQLAEGLGLVGVMPLEEARSQESGVRSQGAAAGQAGVVGNGRFGDLLSIVSLGQLAAKLKQFLKIGGLHVVGELGMPISRVAIACGSAGEFLEVAIKRSCQVLVTGETRLHTCYEAESRGVALLLAGHYASERFGVERLAEVIAQQFSAVKVWASNDETDPLLWL